MGLVDYLSTGAYVGELPANHLKSDNTGEDYTTAQGLITPWNKWNGLDSVGFNSLPVSTTNPLIKSLSTNLYFLLGLIFILNTQ